MTDPYDTPLGAGSDTERVKMAVAAGAIVGTWIWDLASDGLIVDEALACAWRLDPALASRPVKLEQVMEAVHPDDQSGLAAAVNEALRRGGRYAWQYRAHGKDGGYRWYEAIGRVELDAGGQARRFSGVVIDIDDRRRDESERERAETLLRSCVEAAPGVVYAKDLNGRLLIGNRGTSELLGHPPEAYIGRTDAELLGDPAQAAAIMATDQRIMRTGRAEQVEEEVSFPDGRHAYWLSTKAPLRNAAGEIIGLVGTSLDVTDRRLMELRQQEIMERYRLAAQATNDAIWDWHIEDGQVIWNEALTALFGHPHAETSAQWWLDHIHPDDRERVDTDIHAVINGPDSAWIGEYRFRRQDGSFATVLDRGTVLRDPAGAPVRMIGAMQDLSARKAAERALAESEERLRLATEAGDMGFWDVDLTQDLLIWPARTKAMFGISPHVEVSMRDFYEGLHPDDRAATSEAFLAAADPARRALYDVEYRTVGKEDGIIRWVAAKGRGVFEAGVCTRVVGVVVDITAKKTAEMRLQELNEHLESRIRSEVAERIRVESALRQSQKMEAVGQLTGGIAHDFNNMLTSVIGPLDMLDMTIGESDPRARRFINMALEGARRAAQLTQRLLAFSRQQPLQPEPVDVGRLLEGMSDLLAHSLGGAVSLQICQSPDLWWSRTDANQLENAVLNLAVNGRDAMEGAGRLTIRASNLEVTDATTSETLDLPMGQYVAIEVSDTGTGMSPEVRAQAFDPFFTTKKVGRGTGLGLSQVYGFVQQCAGHIRICSELGHGTSVTIYLLRLLTEAQQADQPDFVAPMAIRGGQELIVLVDDEPAVREFTREALAALDYRVIACSGAAEALQALDAHDDVALLFTDVVMPDVNGPQLAEQARQRIPALKVLFASGYTRQDTLLSGVIREDVYLLGKPFTVEQLAKRVRAVLDSVA